MKARLASLIAVIGMVSVSVVAQAQGPSGPLHDGRGGLAYVIAGLAFQFGALDLASGRFVPIGPGLPPDAGAQGLVQGPGSSLFTLTFSGNLAAVNPFTGEGSTVGYTGLRDCSVPGSNYPDCANVIGQVGGHLYAADFANNLYSVDSKTGVATLIGPTGMPALTFAPFSANADGTVNVYSESFVSAHGRLFANFATATTDFVTVNPVIPGALYEIDRSTGQATRIGPTDTNITAMVNVNDTVYAFDIFTNQVLVLDVTTGETTPVTGIDPAAGPIAGAAPASPFPAVSR
jgi:hypothetical protein